MQAIKYRFVLVLRLPLDCLTHHCGRYVRSWQAAPQARGCGWHGQNIAPNLRFRQVPSLRSDEHADKPHRNILVQICPSRPPFSLFDLFSPYGENIGGSSAGGCIPPPDGADRCSVACRCRLFRAARNSQAIRDNPDTGAMFWRCHHAPGGEAIRHFRHRLQAPLLFCFAVHNPQIIGSMTLFCKLQYGLSRGYILRVIAVKCAEMGRQLRGNTHVYLDSLAAAP